MPEASALGPIDPASVPQGEEEKKAPWIVRKLVGSMTGRIVMSSYESLRAAGTSVVCLSPWGDSSPLLLPCIRFRDLVMHTVIAATGGTAAIAAPVMGPISDTIFSSLGDTILVEIGLHTGFEVTTKVADDLLIEHPVKHILPVHSARLETTSIKELLITLKYKHTVEDANLGFFRSSVHGDNSLFASVKDYIAVEKGWFSPYLFASSRRPIIPRTMTPDVVFCHGPFLSGDYKIGETLLNESALTITLASAPLSNPTSPPAEHHSSLSIKLPTLSNLFERSRTPSPEPSLAPPAAPPQPRRLVLLIVGLKPHRTFWTTSARPGESVIRYQLLNGCPAVVVPAKVGAPLLAWDTLTLEHLWGFKLPEEGEVPNEQAAKHGFHGVVTVLFEYLDLCIDWERVILPEGETKEGMDEKEKKDTVKDAISLLVAAAVRSGNSKEVKKDVDKERSGIVIWRIP